MKRRHWMAIDFVVASFVALFCLLTGEISRTPVMHPAGLLPSLALGAALFLAIGLRRRGPMASFWTLAAVALIVVRWPSQVSPESVTLLSMAYVLYLVTVACARRTSVLALAVSLAEILVVEVLVHGGPGYGVGQAMQVAFATCIAWMIGYSVRQRRAYIETLQVQAASSAVEQERLRIARELHDVVAHSMSVIAVQAGFGEYVIDSNPADARAALAAIQATSREALAELRRMLGMLRQQETGAVPLAPEPRLADLDRLIERTRAAAIEVSLIRAGTALDLPASLDVSAYRIIQEALTNVVRHAGGRARCTVTVAYGADVLMVEVTDDGGLGGGQHHSPGSGHGLIGMRERVHLCRGEFSAGPLPYGGFRVHARLPVPELPQPGRTTLTTAASS
jgi:signal transduction histidine kinase